MNVASSVNTGLVSGRRYTRTRPRGHVAWSPRGEAVEIVERVTNIIAEYDQALTIRQIFYRLVGKYAFEKTEKAYSRLGEYLNRARRAGLISWGAIRDDGDIVPDVPGWNSLTQFREYVEALAEIYFRTPVGESYVEVWVETAGMVPQIQSIANEFGVRVIGSGGFASSTQRYYAAQRLCSFARAYDNNPCVVMIGDYDPSGLSIMDSSCADVLAFTAKYDVGVLFDHLAVTSRQAIDFNLESAPQKKTDNRGEYMPDTYQAEALDPNVLAAIVHTRLLELLDQKALDQAKARTEVDKNALTAGLEAMSKHLLKGSALVKNRKPGRPEE